MVKVGGWWLRLVVEIPTKKKHEEFQLPTVLKLKKLLGCLLCCFF